MAPINFEDDFKAIFSDTDFGEEEGTVFYNGVPVEGGHFDDVDIEVTLGEGVEQVVPSPRFIAPVSALPRLQEGDIMTIRGYDHKVQYWMREHGVVTVVLEIVIK